MKTVATLVAVAVAVSSGSAVAQTADHAPTKPAAEAAARYDRSAGKSAPGGAKGADDNATGLSSGAGPSPAGQSPPANEPPRTNADPRQPK